MIRFASRYPGRSLRTALFGACVSMACVSLAWVSPVAAQSGLEGDAITPVFAFNRICYGQVPALQGIRNMATQLGWKPLTDDELAPFGSKADWATLEGWDVQLGNAFYRLGLSQGPASDDIVTQFPDFETGTSTSCTLILGDEHDAATVASQMQELAGKEPVQAAVDEGSVLTTSWAGGNADFKVFLFNKVSKTGEGNVLNVTLISKE